MVHCGCSSIVSGRSVFKLSFSQALVQSRFHSTESSNQSAHCKTVRRVLQFYSQLMRRLLSALLGINFLVVVLAPALEAAHVDSAVPLCCRAHGKHHCEAMGGQASQNASESSSDRSVRASSAKCPMYHFVPGRSLAKFAVTSVPPALQYVNTYRLPARHSAVFVSAGFSSHTDRGPPFA